MKTIETNLSGPIAIKADLGIVRLGPLSFTVKETGELIPALTEALKVARDKDDHRELGTFR
jgi:hypothetical protein